MPLSRRVAAFNARVTNHITRPFAGWLPGFAIVTHVGRRSGRTYRTPVNLFRDGERFVVALTYGRDSEWVKNVMSAGGCTLRTRRTTIEVVAPRVYVDDTRRLVPIPARWMLGLLDVVDFLSLERAGG